jgi:hypothetical protein
VLYIKVRVYASDFLEVNQTAAYNALYEGGYIDKHGFLINEINYDIELALNDPTLT